jgi:hypothetical protein
MNTLALFRYNYNNPMDAKNDFLGGKFFYIKDTETKLSVRDLPFFDKCEQIKIVWNHVMPPILLNPKKLYEE